MGFFMMMALLLLLYGLVCIAKDMYEIRCDNQRFLHEIQHLWELMYPPESSLEEFDPPKGNFPIARFNSEGAIMEAQDGEVQVLQEE